MSGIYRAGTIAVAGGSKAVVGTGTAFLANVKQGDQLFVASQAFSGVVDTITDDTHLTLYENWGGVTASGLGYWTVQTALEWNPVAALNTSLAAVIAAINGGGWAGHPTATTNPHATTLIQALAAQGLTPAADQAAYFTSASAAALTALTTFGRLLMGSAGALPGSAVAVVANAAAPDIGAAASNFIREDGTTGHTAYANPAAGAGTWRVVRYNGVKTLTNSANLICPAGVDYVTAVGDILVWLYEGASVWRCIGGQKANGAAVSSIAVAGISDASADAKTLLTDPDFATMWGHLGGGALGKLGYTAPAVFGAAPTVVFATNGTLAPTYTVRVHKYWVLGNTVFFSIALTITANAYTGAAGEIRIMNLPFANAGGVAVAVTVGATAKMTLPAGTATLAAEIPPGASYIRFRAIVTNAASPAVDTKGIPPSTAGVILSVSGFYPK